MKGGRLRAQRGYTFTEVMFVVAIGSGCLAMALGLFDGADELSSASRHRMQVAEDFRDTHAKVRAVLRNASLATIANLDSTGTAHAPRFQAVEGASGGAPTLGAVMEIAYVRTAADLDGAGPVGRIVLRAVGSASGQTLAERVVESSWHVSLSGRVCTVRLGVVALREGEAPLTLTGETVLFLENA